MCEGRKLTPSTAREMRKHSFHTALAMLFLNLFHPPCPFSAMPRLSALQLFSLHAPQLNYLIFSPNLLFTVCHITAPWAFPCAATEDTRWAQASSVAACTDVPSTRSRRVLHSLPGQSQLQHPLSRYSCFFKIIKYTVVKQLKHKPCPSLLGKIWELVLIF